MASIFKALDGAHLDRALFGPGAGRPRAHKPDDPKGATQPRDRRDRIRCADAPAEDRGQQVRASLSERDT